MKTLGMLCLFGMSMALIYTFIANWLLFFRARRATRWLATHYAERWSQLPWFYRWLGPREIGLRFFLRQQPVSEPDFALLYSGVRCAEIQSWVSLGLAVLFAGGFFLAAPWARPDAR